MGIFYLGNFQESGELGDCSFWVANLIVFVYMVYDYLNREKLGDCACNLAKFMIILIGTI